MSWTDLSQLAAWGLMLAAAGSIGVHSLITGISPMPTLPWERRVLFSALPHLPGGDSAPGAVFELGAGWGSLAFPLARRYPEREVLAYELSPIPWAWCQLRRMVSRRPNLRVYRADFFSANLSGAALVVCYLHPGAMARLAPKLKAELPPGAVVVSHGFALPGWRAEAEFPTPSWYGGRVYRYRV